MSAGAIHALRASVIAVLAMLCLNPAGRCWAQVAIQIVYRPVAMFYHGGTLDYGNLDTVRLGCEKEFGKSRCLSRTLANLQEVEVAIETDLHLVALIIEIDNSGPRTVVYLRVSCHEYKGRITRGLPCGPGESNEQCLDSAVPYFRKALRDYDQLCQRGGVPCRADPSEHVVH